MSKEDALNQGEGNKTADTRYRKSVRETVKNTTHEERAEKARTLSDQEKAEARKAEEKGRSRSKG